jgi:dihydrofolate reductase
MRQVKIFGHISLDGVVQPPGDDDYANGGWTAPYRSSAGVEAIAAPQGKRFDLLLGRRTYDLWSNHWPKIKGGPFADAINAATKFVATHRPESLEWGPVESLGPDLIEGIRGLKSKDGPDLVVWGSTTLTPVLFDQGLVDEVIMAIYPVMFGQGKRFFANGAQQRELALVNTKATPTGVLINTYRHIGSLRRSSDQPGR